MSNDKGFGFSAFRIFAGMGMLILGISKIYALSKVGFNPYDYGLSKFFVHLYASADTTVSPVLQPFFNKHAVVWFGFLLPFLEVITGLLIATGFKRSLGATIGIFTVCAINIGCSAAFESSPTMPISILYTCVLAIMFYMVYLQTYKNMPDPLALDNILKRKNKK